MKLEDQVCSLELAKRLKELGMKQGGVFKWHLDIQPKMSGEERWALIFTGSIETRATNRQYVSAFTVAELGEMLPSMDFCFEKYTPTRWEFFFDGKYSERKEFKKCNEADARAKMLVYLLENNLVDMANSWIEKMTVEKEKSE